MKVLPCLVVKPSFREVASLRTCMSLGLTSPHGVGLDSYCPYLRARKALRRFFLLFSRRFESSGMTVQAMCVEGDEPFGSRFERFWSQSFRNLPAKGTRCSWIRLAGQDLLVRAKSSWPRKPLGL
jgi:hypothetical protein